MSAPAEGTQVDADRIPADAVTLLDGAGRATGWMPLACDLGPAQVDAAGVPATVVSAAHGDWELRMLRVDGDAEVPGAMLTGCAVSAADPQAVLVTMLDQGLDLCAPGSDGVDAHSELRILIPWDGQVSIAQTTDETGSAVAMPQVRVHELPAGFPMVVAVRRGAEPPSLPQITEATAAETGKKLRIRKTGSSIPEIELAPDAGGHAISVKWPDRSREVITLPAGAR